MYAYVILTLGYAYLVQQEVCISVWYAYVIWGYAYLRTSVEVCIPQVFGGIWRYEYVVRYEYLLFHKVFGGYPLADGVIFCFLNSQIGLL